MSKCKNNYLLVTITGDKYRDASNNLAITFLNSYITKGWLISKYKNNYLLVTIVGDKYRDASNNLAITFLNFYIIKGSY